MVEPRYPTAQELFEDRVRWSPLTEQQIVWLMENSRDNPVLHQIVSARYAGVLSAVDCLFEAVVGLTRQNDSLTKAVTSYARLSPMPPVIVAKSDIPTP